MPSVNDFTFWNCLRLAIGWSHDAVGTKQLHFKNNAGAPCSLQHLNGDVQKSECSSSPIVRKGLTRDKCHQCFYLTHHMTHRQIVQCSSGRKRAFLKPLLAPVVAPFYLVVVRLW